MKVAISFVQRVPDHLLPVVFVFHIDPVRKCHHALLIKSVSGCDEESEFLFVPYSAFTVRQNGIHKERPRKRQRLGVEHWTVHVDVVPDNLDVAEDVDLVDWH
eukprot:TRINITY_DN115606_c0_g1_i1.p1 TRINITY_DN115606_c0_g1~~TRINITY_DN115606_c0_g1_i1.p1  ORF type:complete len:103 (-),score=5.47 TRINITY_DN115606_c0_g1_i1:150-458(-)